MKTIAIMGANGFIGRNLTEHLSGRHVVLPITRKQIDLLEGQAVQDFFTSRPIDVVFNCASQGGSRKTGYDAGKADVVQNNLRLFFNQERCLKPHMKLISFGSGAQYDKTRPLQKVGEEELGRQIPHDGYGFSKFVLSKYIGSRAAPGSVYNPVIFGLYGQYEDYSFKFISNAIVKNLLQLPIEINQNVVFDYLYIKDFLRIMDLLIEQDFPCCEFNLTPTESLDLVTAARLINNCSDRPSEVVVKNTGLNNPYTGSNRRLLAEIGAFKFTSCQAGIADLYRYYQKNMDRIDLAAVRSDDYIKNCRTC